MDIDCNQRFEQFVKSKFPEYFKECPEFIRHKTTLIYPGVLLDNGIKLTKNVHKQGEFMISRCSGYHAGFNFGFNIAEAVNFALSDWIKVASNVECCKCTNDSVKINMGSFLQNIKLSDLNSLILAHSASRQRNRSVDFADLLATGANSGSHHKFSLSENLHSFKNTPLNIKASPKRS